MPIDPTTLYVTPQDIREAVAPDGEYQGTCATMSDEQLDRYIRQAQSRVDSTVGESFTPSNVPELLSGTTLALATFYATLGYRKGKSLDEYHPVYLMYQDALAVLKQIQDNSLDPTPSPDTDPTPARAKPRVINPINARFFTLRDAGLTSTTAQPDEDILDSGDPRIVPREW